MGKYKPVFKRSDNRAGRYYRNRWKTGTTNAAGYCLVLYSKNKKGDDIVSIVYKGKTRSDMYTLMNQILSTFAN